MRLLIALLTLCAALMAQQNRYSTFSILYQETARASDTIFMGKYDHIPDHFFGRWEDGTTVTWTTSETHPGIKAIAVNYYAQGIGVMRNTSTNLISVGGDGTPVPIPKEDAKCSQVIREIPIVGSEKLLGFNTIHSRFENPGAIEEAWFAPDLGCAMLKRYTRWKEDGKLDGSWTLTEAKSASVERPPVDLYLLPANAVDVSPVEYGVTLYESVSKAGQMMGKHVQRYTDNKDKRRVKGVLLPSVMIQIK